jgi:hypothetical protein
VLEAAKKTRRRRGFLIGLFVGQLLILAMDFGGDALVWLLRDKYPFRAPVPLRSLVFVGMTAGIVITALLILFVLGLQGAGWMFGAKKVGFWTAVGRGVKRTFKAAWALGLTLGVVGGTAWLLIPRDQWKPTADWVGGHAEKAYTGARDWTKGLIAPKSPKP